MVELFSFCMGALSTLFAFKFGKVFYRVYPYMTKPSFLSRNEGKECIIIAGATDGIGQQYARHLSQHFKIIAIGRNPSKLESLKQISPNIATYKVDFAENCLKGSQLQQSIVSVTNADKLEKLKIRGIINCVGIANFAPFSTTPLEQIAKINSTNIQSQLYLLKMLYSLKQKDHLASNPFFINLSSGAANYPNKFSSAYSGSKAYISNVMKVLAKQDQDTTFLDLKPWFVKTKMIGYMNTWDTVLPQEVVDGSLRLLGKRTEGSGTWKHELIEQFRYVCLKIIQKRTEEQQARLQKIKALRSKRGNKKTE